MSQLHSPRLTYADVKPLDWFQFRALLWDALAEIDEDRPDRWREIAACVNVKCPSSPPRPALAYRQVFNRSAAVRPSIRNVSRRPELGPKIWNEILYEDAQYLFHSPAFMNLGYVDLRNDAEPIKLKEEHEPSRLFIQLYRRVVSSVDFGGRAVLEVGCGSGGGSSYIMRYLRPTLMVGVDVLEGNIRACARLVRCGDSALRWGTPRRWSSAMSALMPW